MATFVYIVVCLDPLDKAKELWIKIIWHWNCIATNDWKVCD
jgi:hypothetical protein